jgi:ribosome biogenesis GTPase
MALGRVLKTTGSLSDVLLDTGEQITCRVKGKLRIGGVTTTNPVVVGDNVVVETESGEGVISEVLDRHNYIVRESPRRKMQRHVLAANVDQALLVTTLREPTFKPGFCDRFLLTCEAYHIPCVIVFNKDDLWSNDDRLSYEECVSTYEAANARVMHASAISGSRVPELEQVLSGKTTLLAGQSGVGKSSLINRLLPDLYLKVGDLSGYSGKGIHTTTFAAMFALQRGFIIDTPGVKEWSVMDMKPEELGQYLPEFRREMDKCRFNNCLHMDEPQCAVKEAVEAGAIAVSRYDSYLSMLEEVKQLKRWEIES